jgi:hypothetical protein
MLPHGFRRGCNFKLTASTSFTCAICLGAAQSRLEVRECVGVQLVMQVGAADSAATPIAVATRNCRALQEKAVNAERLRAN